MVLVDGGLKDDEARLEMAERKLREIKEIVDRYPSDIIAGRIRRIIDPTIRNPQ